MKAPLVCRGAVRPCASPFFVGGDEACPAVPIVLNSWRSARPRARDSTVPHLTSATRSRSGGKHRVRELPHDRPPSHAPPVAVLEFFVEGKVLRLHCGSRRIVKAVLASPSPLPSSCSSSIREYRHNTRTSRIPAVSGANPHPESGRLRHRILPPHLRKFGKGRQHLVRIRYHHSSPAKVPRSANCG